MLFINERYWVRSVAARWAKQYNSTSMQDKINIGNLLNALNPATATADEVDVITGNTYWTTQLCNACGMLKRNVVVFGRSGFSATLCSDCEPELHKLFKDNN